MRRAVVAIATPSATRVGMRLAASMAAEAVVERSDADLRRDWLTRPRPMAPVGASVAAQRQGAAAHRERDAARRSALAVRALSPASAKPCSRTAGAASSIAARRCSTRARPRRHLSDRDRPHPCFLHRAFGARDHARLLASRQLRRRTRSIRRRHHLWSGVATSNSSVVHLPGKALRALVIEMPTSRSG